MVTMKDKRSGWVRPAVARRRPRFRFARSGSDALIGGVAGGLGERLGVDPTLVRIAFVVLTFAGAVGVVLYIVAWSLALEPGDRRAPKVREPVAQQNIAFSLMALGLAFLLRSVGLWLGDSFFIPILIGAIGAGVVSSGSGRQRKTRGRDAVYGTTGGRPSLLNLIVGGAFVIGGVSYFLITNRTVGGMYAIVLAIVVTTFGLAIVFGPWVYRTANQLGEERRDRIRSEERAELAAHLHDSVLQTLALIQRNANSPRRMANLARRQERELRTWLYGQAEFADGIEAAFAQITDEIEESYDVAIETVVVGECPIDGSSMAVVQACREAAMNAARHSGTSEISIYVECEPGSMTAYVRDRGRGFDPDDLPAGRRGITDSIHGRIERHGGEVTITSAPGEGCEVQIVLPTGASS